MYLIKGDGTNVKGCSHMQLWAVLRGNTRINSDRGAGDLWLVQVETRGKQKCCQEG